MNDDDKKLDAASSTLLVLFFATATYTTFYFTNDNPQRWLMLAFSIMFLVLCLWSFYRPFYPMSISLMVYIIFILYGYSDHGNELVAEIGAYLYFGFFVTASGAFVAYKRRINS